AARQHLLDASQHRTGPLAVLAIVVAHDLILHTLEGALGLRLGSAGGHLRHELREALGLLTADIHTVDRLGEAQIRIHARDHDPRVNRQELDADERHADVRVDHHPLVEDHVDDVRQPTWSEPLKISTWRRRYGHILILLLTVLLL